MVVFRLARFGAVVVSMVLSSTVLSAGLGDPGPAGTTASFETQEVLGDAAVSLVLGNAVGGTRCAIDLMISGSFPSQGALNRLIYLEWEDGHTSWSHATFSPSVYAHVEELVDTRSATGNHWLTQAKISVSVWPGVTLTVAGQQLRPWPEVFEDAPDESVRIDVECDGHASVSLEGSRETRLLSTANAENGVGAGYFNHAEGVLLARTGGDFAAPEVRMRAGTLGENLGALRLESPDEPDPQVWLLESGKPRTLKADGGPGEYQLMLDRVGDRNGFWALLAGWWPIDGLDEVKDLPRLQSGA